MRTVGFVVGGAAAMALGAQISVPMVPVPTTLQTLALFTVAQAAGPWRAAGAALLYLLLVLLDLPVLADAQRHGGWAFFELRTAGYVLGFVPAAALGALGRGRFLTGALAALAGHLLVLALGAAVLAWHIGLEPALTHGVAPFWLAALVKSALAPLLARPLRR